MNNLKRKIFVVLFLYALISVFITGCGNGDTKQNFIETVSISEYTTLVQETSDKVTNEQFIENITEQITEQLIENTAEQTTEIPAISQKSFNLSDISPYSGSPYIAINNNTPFFSNSDLKSVSFEEYSPLDNLGRCGVAYACVGKDIMPTEKRGSIGSVKPSGWQSVKYDNVDGKYLYNRCHLIGYQLTGENANERNLITGTRYLNIEGMLPFENMTADYVKETNNHVLYRSTPIFEDNNLLANGVLMEGYSVEDNGAGICFCVYAYNVQPDIDIDYSNGNSKLSGTVQDSAEEVQDLKQSSYDVAKTNENSQTSTYILNANTNKFHYTSCSSVKQMSEKNKRKYNGTRDDVIKQGFIPCKRCNP